MNMRLPSRRNGASATAKRRRLERGADILTQAANSIQMLAESIDEDFLVAVDKLLAMHRAGYFDRDAASSSASTRGLAVLLIMFKRSALSQLSSHVRELSRAAFAASPHARS